jgi:hypothetical protein
MPRPASTLTASALVVALFVLGCISTADALPGTPATRMPSERSCRLAWDARSNEVSRHRLAASGRWRRGLLVGAVAAGTVAIPGTPGGRVSWPACVLLARDGERAREAIGRWRHGRVIGWNLSRVFELSLRLESNVRILHDGRVT